MFAARFVLDCCVHLPAIDSMADGEEIRALIGSQLEPMFWKPEFEPNWDLFRKGLLAGPILCGGAR